MNGLNKVQIIGNLVKDSELTFLNDNKNVVAKFTVAVNETFKKKDGTKQENVEFFNINLWGDSSKNLNPYLKKGTLVYVEGKQRTESWDKEGVKHYKTTLVASMITLLGSKPAGQAGTAAPAAANQETAKNQAKAYVAQEEPAMVDGNNAFGGQDDDLPF